MAEVWSVDVASFFFPQKALASQIAGGKLKGSANLPKAEHIRLHAAIFGFMRVISTRSTAVIYWNNRKLSWQELVRTALPEDMAPRKRFRSKLSAAASLNRMVRDLKRGFDFPIHREEQKGIAEPGLLRRRLISEVGFNALDMGRSPWRSI